MEAGQLAGHAWVRAPRQQPVRIYVGNLSQDAGANLSLSLYLSQDAGANLSLSLYLSQDAGARSKSNWRWFAQPAHQKREEDTTDKWCPNRTKQLSGVKFPTYVSSVISVNQT
jgi:hypothetical protein